MAISDTSEEGLEKFFCSATSAQRLVIFSMPFKKVKLVMLCKIRTAVLEEVLDHPIEQLKYFVDGKSREGTGRRMISNDESISQITL